MTDDEILALARERFQIIATAEYEIREAALEDLKFTYNVDEGQWDAATRAERQKDGRPCLTANLLRKFVAIVANQERENRIAGKVRPVDDAGDPETAAIIEDLVRHIEYQSNAEVIYASAGERAAAGGYAYWRILAEYADDGFDQELRLKKIANPFSVYLDPRRMYGFVTEMLPEAEFRAQYPDADPVDVDWQSRGESWTLWYEPKKVRVAEYFYKEPVTRAIAQVKRADGAVEIIDAPKGATKGDVLVDAAGAPVFEVLKTRTVETHVVRWCKLTGHQVLAKRDWPGREIPIIEVVGDEVDVDGKVYKRSLIRDGKDPQRQYNYWLTAATEQVALAPKAPYIVKAQEVSGYENEWADANRKNLPYLRFNPQGGNERPRREAPPQMSSGFQQMLQLSATNVKDTLGMFESFLGEPSNERSGRAIGMRERRGQIGTFHFPDNLRRAVIETVKQLIDLIPRIYDTERVVRLRNEKGEERRVTLNQTIAVPPEAGGGTTILHDLSRGKYDVVADVRTYSTRRQENVELLTQSIQYAPIAAPALLPLLFENVDSEIAAKVEQAVEKMLGLVQQGALSPNGQATRMPAMAGNGAGMPTP